MSNQVNKKKEALHHLTFIAFIIVILIPFYFKDSTLKNKAYKVVRPLSYLSVEDLEKLVYEKGIKPKLYKRLQKQLNTPYVFNSNPKIFLTEKKGFSPLKVTHWNIQRGYNIDQIKEVFVNPVDYYATNRKNIKNKLHENLKSELREISASDIICLNEVDIGMPRTDYRNIVSELASELGYSYAFATEFVELGPIVSKLKIDPDKYLGLHGNAIISKYPIKKAKIIRLPEAYRWYESELKKKSILEGVRRAGAKTLFREQIISEVRRGGRNALVVDIELPSKQAVTIVSTHLEDRCFPKGRFKQMKYLLDNLKYEQNPLVLAGDLNTTTADSIPTSFKKEVVKRLKDPNFLARQALFLTVPVLPPGVGNLSAAAISTTLKYKDPAIVSIPLLSPNAERKLFTYLKDFRFADGRKFDFDGDSKRSANGKRGLLANSNERQLKGFESTFKFEKPNVIGYFKLDWFFVKPKSGRLKPFNGQTLKLVNESHAGRISDHDPITLDLLL